MKSLKKKSTSQSAFFNLRILLGLLLFLAAIFLALHGSGAFSNAFAQATSTKADQSLAAKQTQPRSGPPTWSGQLLGPVRQDSDLRSLPYIAPTCEVQQRPLAPHPRPETGLPEQEDPFQSLFGRVSALLRPPPTMPGPLLIFDGMNQVQSFCGCFPPDPDGDVGPNHYVQSVNSSIKIFDKSGNPLNGVAGTTYNSFFAPLGPSAPCGNHQNRGDGFVFYDHIADRWVVSDGAFPSFPGTSFYECIGVSQTGDPVAGGWFLYALQTDPANPNFNGDYPKFGLWPDAYYLSVNLFSPGPTFNGMRVSALDRAAMLNGGPANAIAFTITPAAMPDTASLVPATFRTGAPPPEGEPEFFLAIDAPFTGGVDQNHVHAWLFHADFITPANSTFGVGPDHLPNADIKVDQFKDAYTKKSNNLVPQNGTSQRLDTLGDRLMTPVVYQNRGGTESLWASHTINFNHPTAIRWYQFDVTGGTLPAKPVQQQDWNNGGDGLWRWMPSIAVDEDGNMAIGYSTSSSAIFPSIRYAGRLATDPLNDLTQGEAIMTNGGGSQTANDNGRGRWGDYTMLTIDPADNHTFWHTNEYYVATNPFVWSTRIGKFNFQGGPTPTPTPTATPTPTPTPSPGTCADPITHSLSQSIVSGNSGYCGFGSNLETRFWRAFNMQTFTGGQEYDVTSISFGIELASSGSGTGQPITVRLYANNVAPFPGGNWQNNLLAEQGINVTDQSLTVLTVPLGTTVPAGTLELVMEVFIPDGQATGDRFAIGSNPYGQTAPGYASAAACGFSNPTDLANVGFLNMHIVFNVHGSCPANSQH
ncbi:MAG: hypothetical protein C5B58_05595 [Acidobacteria bacterium]|nr:MAG: hypothetical protein C5B58_05595 [Acidobacteriota bacterium]